MKDVNSAVDLTIFNVASWSMYTIIDYFEDFIKWRIFLKIHTNSTIFNSIDQYRNSADVSRVTVEKGNGKRISFLPTCGMRNWKKWFPFLYAGWKIEKNLFFHVKREEKSKSSFLSFLLHIFHILFWEFRLISSLSSFIIFVINVTFHLRKKRKKSEIDKWWADKWWVDG